MLSSANGSPTHPHPLTALVRARPLLTGTVALALGMVALALPPLLDGIVGECVHELAIAAVMLAVIALIGGPRALQPSTLGMGFALRTSAYLLIIAALPMVAVCAMPALVSATLVPTWPLMLAAAIALAAAVALLEESLFRGIVLSACVERAIRGRGGIVGAATVASVAFGLMHVLPTLTGAITPAVVTQALAKLATMTAVGLLISAVYLRTHNLWCAVVVHAVNDLFAFVPVFLFGVGIGAAGGDAGDALTGLTELGELGELGASASAVAAVADVMLVVGQLLLMLVYVPVAVIGVRQLRMVAVGDGTIFSARWEARTVARVPLTTGEAAISKAHMPPPPPATMSASHNTQPRRQG